MRVKEIVDLKGCYSAHDVGEKEIELNAEKIKSIIGDEKFWRYNNEGYGFLDESKLAKAIARADIIKAKGKE